MRKLNYEPKDSKELALEHLEKDVKYFATQFKINGMDDDDIAQELRMRVWEKLDEFDSKKSRLQTWGVTVMRNHLYNINKRQNRKKRYFISVTEAMLDKPNTPCEIKNGNLSRYK